MKYQGYLSHEDQNTTNFKHGEVTALPFGLSQSERAEIQIFLTKKTTDPETPAVPTVLLDCKMLLDEAASPLPVNPEHWSEKMTSISDTPENQTLLSNYRIFWKAGVTSPIV